MISLREGQYLLQDHKKPPKVQQNERKNKYNIEEYILLPVSWGSWRTEAFPYFTNLPTKRIVHWDLGIRNTYPENFIPFKTLNLTDEVELDEIDDPIDYKLNGFGFGADYSLYDGNPDKCHSFGLAVEKDSMPVMDLMQHVRISNSTKKEFIWNNLVISFKSIEEIIFTLMSAIRTRIDRCQIFSMIQTQTVVAVIDNSGARLARCINTLRSGRFARVGDEISVVVQQVKPMGKSVLKVKRGDVSRALVVRTRKEWQRVDGSWIKFDDNAIVLLNTSKQMVGTKITSAIAKEIKGKWPDVAKLTNII